MDNDKETKEMLSTADHVKAMMDSEGWKYVYAKLSEKILDLQNINNLDMADVTTLSAQLAARKMAVAYVWEWLNKDVIGFVGQQESNSQKLIEKQESYIDRQ